ncbi:hypothetical protein N0V90_009458 [Kalmusia sp. IMI 367209]|nr:hypothetical protein N0V90_009458 [Kalmusia sp. IMI 367209]
MSNARPHGSSKHGRLHRRGNSASSMTSPLSPGAFTFSRSETPAVTYEEEPWSDIARPMPAATSHPLKIKPYLRKLSSKDHNDLDLSRPAAENERLAGLGITEYGSGYARSVGDVSFAPVKSRSHARSTSNTSQFSTSSSLQRPLPAIRQTPRPYTPPISKSTPSSVLLNGDNEPDDNIMTDEELRLRQAAYDPSRRSGSLSSSTPGAAPALRIHTTSSSSFLAGSYSHSAVSLTSPVAQSRPRGDTVKSMDTTSPSSRTSFDKAFGIIRGGRDSPADAASRAASIRAARQAFQQKEEAKERKYDREVHKQAERETRKQYRKDERERRKSESHEKKRSRSVSESNYERASRPSVGGRQYSDHREAHTRTLPNHIPSANQEKGGFQAAPKVTKSRQAKGRWLRFVLWFKTRVLRMSSRLHVHGG